MSILIKGMKMPELYKTYKVNFAMTNDGKIVMGMCPLNETGYRPVGEVVALPDKHGDLIDRGALKKMSYEVKDNIGYVQVVDVWDIDREPTIIESEDSE